MEEKSGCVVCGRELTYVKNASELTCIYCNRREMTYTHCVAGHYLCDYCHAMQANDIIEAHCTSSSTTDPIELALMLMKHPSIKMHGPEHHFLTPAVLLAAYYNQRGDSQPKISKIKQARQRAEKVPGGSCGFHGNCGAAVGAGIFVSLIHDATPLKKNEWQQANLMTGESLLTIAKLGGPRCCKRDSFATLDLASRKYGLSHRQHITCDFSRLNKECLGKKCPYFHR
ncbi:MAG: SAM-dependent methyltransferase [Chitinivibrionales bacterium]|nr:SAM-dependent methyltransferase [Chitinivibrionales bacterium]